MVETLRVEEVDDGFLFGLFCLAVEVSKLTRRRRVCDVLNDQPLVHISQKACSCSSKDEHAANLKEAINELSMRVEGLSTRLEGQTTRVEEARDDSVLTVLSNFEKKVDVLLSIVEKHFARDTSVSLPTTATLDQSNRAEDGAVIVVNAEDFAPVVRAGTVAAQPQETKTAYEARLDELVKPGPRTLNHTVVGAGCRSRSLFWMDDALTVPVVTAAYRHDMKKDECPYCAASFRDRCALRHHLQHTKEHQVFACCRQLYATKVLFDHHMKTYGERHDPDTFVLDWALS